jgi:hypothetical protein
MIIKVLMSFYEDREEEKGEVDVGEEERECVYV